MRRLLILRHAKAERAIPGASDLARSLTKEGREDATRMGEYLVRHHFRPDRAFISTSARTRETWDAVSPALGPGPAANYEPRIYDAKPSTLIDIIKEAPDSARSLMLVGHNPGFHELAVLLMATGDVDTRERLREKFPTCGLAILDFAFEHWRELHARSGRLERFVTPKTIGSPTN